MTIFEPTAEHAQREPQSNLVGARCDADQYERQEGAASGTEP